MKERRKKTRIFTKDEQYEVILWWPNTYVPYFGWWLPLPPAHMIESSFFFLSISYIFLCVTMFCKCNHEVWTRSRHINCRKVTFWLFYGLELPVDLPYLAISCVKVTYTVEWKLKGDHILNIKITGIHWVVKQCVLNMFCLEYSLKPKLHI